jgi:hypothetical protein
MKYMIGVMVLLVSLGLFAGLGAMTDSVKDVRTDWVTDSFVLTTNTTTVNGTVQLNNPLWESQISDTKLSSNLTSDTPAITGYTAASKSIILNGLATNTSRLISVQYRTFGLNDYPGADTGSKFIPSAFILAAVFLPLLAVVMILLGR